MSLSHHQVCAIRVDHEELALIVDNVFFPRRCGRSAAPIEEGGEIRRSVGRGVNPKKSGILPAKPLANLGQELPLVYFVTGATCYVHPSCFPSCARPRFSSSPLFMFHPARSHGRALHAVFQPCARLNLASDIGKPTWSGPLQRRRHWTRDGGRAKASFYEDKFAAATKLKETGLFRGTKRTGKSKTLLGDGSRVNLVNKKLASTMSTPSSASHPSPPVPNHGLVVPGKNGQC